jgi:Ca2+-binding RTX toxin-like protein
VSSDTFINMEGVRGSPFCDTLIGSDNPNVVEYFVGDGGNDFIDGDAGVDFASWFAVPVAAGGVNAFIENGSGVVSHDAAGTDTLINIEGLIGTNSNDTLAGGLGDQWFRGRGGSDHLDGGAGSDTADYSMDPGAVTVNLSANSATDGWGGIWGLQGTDTLLNIENVEGSSFNDSLTGDDGENTLAGGGGSDVLTGGFADDIFDYNALSDAGTTGDDITDFQAGGGDVLDLHDLLVSIGAAADPFASGSGHLRFFDAGSDTLVQIDSDGGNDSYVTLATLTGVLDPSQIIASDYVL